MEEQMGARCSSQVHQRHQRQWQCSTICSVTPGAVWHHLQCGTICSVALFAVWHHWQCGTRWGTRDPSGDVRKRQGCTRELLPFSANTAFLVHTTPEASLQPGVFRSKCMSKVQKSPLKSSSRRKGPAKGCAIVYQCQSFVESVTLWSPDNWSY